MRTIAPDRIQQILRKLWFGREISSLLQFTGHGQGGQQAVSQSESQQMDNTIQCPSMDIYRGHSDVLLQSVLHCVGLYRTHHVCLFCIFQQVRLWPRNRLSECKSELKDNQGTSSSFSDTAWHGLCAAAARSGQWLCCFCCLRGSSLTDLVLGTTNQECTTTLILESQEWGEYT